MDNNFIINIKEKGFHIEKGFYEREYIQKINDISSNILRFEQKLNYIGLGNRSKRNGITFTANLMFKNQIFSDLMLNSGLLNVPNVILGKYNLSSYTLITSERFNEFKYWWHQDYPYSKNYYNIPSNVDIGILIPLIDFNEEVGATVFIPKSHVNNENLNNLDTLPPEAEILQSNIGDIFIYDGRLFHSGSENKSNILRSLLSIHFVVSYVPPDEDMKIQYSELRTENKELKKIMTNYHTPARSLFGCNRTWRNTVYLLPYPWKIFGIIFFIYNRYLILKIILRRNIYKIFT